MRIGIEAQRIFRQKKHGMDYVVLQEILEIQKIDNKNEYFIFVKPGPDRCVKDSRNVHIIEISCPSYPLWEQWALPRAVEECDVELLHCTSNTAPIFCSVPMILTLHDIIFLEPRDKNNKNDVINPKVEDKYDNIKDEKNKNLIISSIKLIREKLFGNNNANENKLKR